MPALLRKNITSTMESPIYHRVDAPYTWLKAYDFGNKKYRMRKNQCYLSVVSEYPHFTKDCVKLIQVATLSLDMTFDMGIYRNMKWSVFKDNIMTALKTSQDKLDFQFDRIQDVAITNNPNELSPAIDTFKNDLFTVVADNSIVFLSQLKVDDVWIFFK